VRAWFKFRSITRNLFRNITRFPATQVEESKAL
jgi:hypothetical protein